VLTDDTIKHDRVIPYFVSASFYPILAKGPDSHRGLCLEIKVYRH
jgi:hypothetical protein